MLSSIIIAVVVTTIVCSVIGYCSDKASEILEFEEDDSGNWSDGW